MMGDSRSGGKGGSCCKPEFSLLPPTSQIKTSALWPFTASPHCSPVLRPAALLRRHEKSQRVRSNKASSAKRGLGLAFALRGHVPGVGGASQEPRPRRVYGHVGAWRLAHVANVSGTRPGPHATRHTRGHRVPPAAAACACALRAAFAFGAAGGCGCVSMCMWM
jgi:hypothetical protein